MESIAEALSSAAYFSLNPLAWAAAIAFALRTGMLRKPVIAAVVTQVLMACLLISLLALSASAVPVTDVFVVLLVPAVLSGLMVSALVLLVSKRRRVVRFVAARCTNRLAYK